MYIIIIQYLHAHHPKSIFHYNLTGPPYYTRSVMDQNVVMLRMMVTEVRRALGYSLRVMLGLIWKRIMHVRMRPLKADV